MTFQIIALTTCLAALTPHASSQGQFVEVQGDREFSGRLIAKPDPSVPTQVVVEDNLDGAILEYFPGTGEYLIDASIFGGENAGSQELMATGNFMYVEPDWLLSPTIYPNDPLICEQWYLNAIQAPCAWDTERYATGLIAAFVDTGVDLDHPDLIGNLVDGWDAISGLWRWEGGQIDDINGHGTLIAGILGAEANNGIGISGVAWNPNLMPMRATHRLDGKANLHDLNAASRKAADAGASVINVSYSGVENNSVETTGSYCRDRGALLFWSAGNAGISLGSVDHEHVVIVTGTDEFDAFCGYNYGTGIDCVAPGCGAGIVSTHLGGGYIHGWGTSFAAPLVAGEALLLMAKEPSLTADQVEDILYSTATDLGIPGKDPYFGHGLINICAALRAPIVGGPIGIDPSTLRAGETASLAIHGAEPGATVWMAYSLSGYGCGPIPAQNLELDISNPNLLGQAVANSQGVAQLSVAIPSGMSGTAIWFQAVSGSLTSPVSSQAIE